MAKQTVKSRQEGGTSGDTEITVSESEIPKLDIPADKDVTLAAEGAKKTEAPAESDELKQLRSKLADAEKNQAVKDKQLTEERERRITAEKNNQESVKKASSSFDTMVAEATSARDGAINAATANLSALKREWLEARESGDAALEVELHDKIAQARFALEAASLDKRNFDVWKKQQEAARKKQDEQAKQTTSTQQYTASEQAWIDAHPRFIDDEEYKQVAIGAHNVALSKGIKADTPAYYEHLNKTLKRYGLEDAKSDEDEDELPEKPARKEVKVSTATSPATYSAPSQTTVKNSSKSVRLTKAEQEMAVRTFGPNSMWKMKLEEAERKFATQKLELEQRRARGENI